jgi:DNA-directed RNA polymerase specialized sigma subunit
MWEAFHLWLKKTQTEIRQKIECDPRQASEIECRYQRAFGHSVQEIGDVLLEADKRLGQIIGCRDATVSKYRRIARARAQTVSSLYNMDLDSSVSIAEAGLLKALDTFYPNHKNGFSSFAYAVVTNDLLRAKGGRSGIYRDLKHELNRLSQQRAKRLNDQEILDYLIDERGISGDQAKRWLLKLRPPVKERVGRVNDLGLNAAASPAPEGDLDDLNLSLGILGKLPDSEWRAISALYDLGLSVDERGALVVDHTSVGSKQIRVGAKLVRTDHTISSHEQVGRVFGATKQALLCREQSARAQLPELTESDLRNGHMFQVIRDQQLGGLGIDPRYLKALYGFSILTLEDLCDKTQQELESISGLGPHAVQLIEESLQVFGYRLKKPDLYKPVATAF